VARRATSRRSPSRSEPLLDDLKRTALVLSGGATGLVMPARHPIALDDLVADLAVPLGSDFACIARQGSPGSAR